MLTFVLLYCVYGVTVHTCCFKWSMGGTYRTQISQHRWAITNHSHSNKAMHARPTLLPLGPAMWCSWIMLLWGYVNTNFFIKSFVFSEWHGVRPKSKRNINCAQSINSLQKRMYVWTQTTKNLDVSSTCGSPHVIHSTRLYKKGN